MFHTLLNQINSQQQGFIALLIGAILVFGALGKLGFLQDFLNLIMVVVGLYLLVWGLNTSNLWKKIKHMKK